jgi:hypothetical protein
MHQRSWILGALALLASVPPAYGQAEAWQRKWYWGLEGGIFGYQTPLVTGTKFAPSYGGHWMITGKRSALLIGFDQIKFPDSTQSAVVDASAVANGGVRLVTFSGARRIQATIYAVPTDKKLQVMLGGGFAIHQITDAQPVGPFASPQELANAESAVAAVDTKAFLVMAGALQYRLNRWAVFGSYNYMAGSKDFLITSSTHAITIGARYALTSAHEEVTTER